MTQDKMNDQEREARLIELEAEVEQLTSISDALSMSLERHRLLLEAHPDPIIEYDFDGAVMYVNPSFEETFGWKREDIIGRPLDFIPDDHLAEDLEFRSRLATGEKIKPFETRRLTKYGMELDIFMSVASSFDQEGAFTGFVEFLRDITDTKMVEDTLRAVQERYRVVMESTPDPIVIFDFSGGVAYVNPAFEDMFGWSLAELMGRDLDFVPVEDAGEYWRVVDEVMSGGKGGMESRRFTRDGRIIDVLSSMAPYMGQGDQIVGRMEILRDISDRKRAEEVLQRAKETAELASHTKSSFLASMSHEIRTPMNAILGMADLLAETSLSVEQQRFVDMFRHAGEGLLGLINDILDLSKVEAGQVELESVTFDLPELVATACDMFTPRASDKGLALTCDIATDVPVRLVGDPARLRQVLVNLLGNAVKFTHNGGISVRVEQLPDLDQGRGRVGLLVTIADTGIGIPGDKLERIFDSFTQADASTTRQYGGTGLGLTISRNLAERMGGRLWAESEPGRGSTFRCIVRLAAPGASEVPVAATAMAVACDGPDDRQLRILMVEDSEDNRTLLHFYLKKTGCILDSAENGQTALEMIKAAVYDIVLMDMHMPIMDGYTATRELRRWEDETGRTRTPVVALTANAMKGDEKACLDAGCDGYLAKPLKKDRLLQAIRTHVRRQAA